MMAHLLLASLVHVRGFSRNTAHRMSRFSVHAAFTTQRYMTSEDVSTETTSTNIYENKNNLDDQVFSAISGDGSIKVTACTVRNIINDVMIMHTMTAVPSDALGRAVVCALLMSNGMQLEQTVQLTVNSDGPLRGLVAIASGKGEVRGYVGSPMLGDLTIEEAIGQGSLQVVKNHPDWPNPYNGITAIRHGDLDRDIGIYLAESEQRSCALAAATSINGILCTSCGGYLIEQLPGAETETLRKVEENLAKIVELDGGNKIPTNLLLGGTTPYQITEMVLEGLDMQPLQQIKPVFKCSCSEDRLVRALRLLPKEDVEDLVKKGEDVEARCEFCGTVYRMGPDKIRKRMNEATGDPAKDADFQDMIKQKESTSEDDK
eukprot:CAMPEP_0198127338 /NCGR_PEP_ID=MMETSP1442-20131203/46923_1 /TAXON_ID= /ORGANISM="Craspedostauros australis, Strain CCMP3328" /LENGTH=374 /DNA_ID=CAMNT_0043787295 /DNA_START=178 /DNA_END=1302 /DNA_ORIENTATION=+